MSKRITNAMVIESMNKLEEKINTVNARVDESARAYKALEARVIALEKGNAEPAKAKAKAKKPTAKAKSAPKAKAKAVPSVAGATYVLADGVGKGTGRKFVQISFAEKPDASVIKALKGAGYRWFGIGNYWSAEATTSTTSFAKSLCK